MEWGSGMWVLGFMAFIFYFSLSGRITKIERQMREQSNGSELNSSNDLRDSLQKRIGECVTLDFYEEEEDGEVWLCSIRNTGLIRIIDVDEKWVYVQVEKGEKKTDKLIRISSIKGIGQ